MSKAGSGFRAVRETIIVQPIEEPTQIGGILLADTHRKLTSDAEVIEVGENVDGRITKGTIVVFNKNAGFEVTINAKQYLVIEEDDVFGLREE